MRRRAVHGPHLAIAPNVQSIRQFQQRVHEVLAVIVRLQDMHEDEIVVAIAGRIAHDGVGNLDDALALAAIQHGAIACKVIELAGTREAAQLRRVKL